MTDLQRQLLIVGGIVALAVVVLVALFLGGREATAAAAAAAAAGAAAHRLTRTQVAIDEVAHTREDLDGAVVELSEIEKAPADLRETATAEVEVLSPEERAALGNRLLAPTDKDPS